MQIPDFRRRLQALGAAPPHEGRLLRAWLQAQPLESGRKVSARTFYPAALFQALPALAKELGGLARVEAEHPAGDGSSRLLVRLADGQTVESVLLLRDGLCVSSQVGCAVGCVFCMTGRSGLLRQLTSGEIAAQVVLARARRPVKKVVFMGMGEPSHNLEAVLEAIDLLGAEGGIAHKNLVISSVGDERLFDALDARMAVPGAVRPALALSLHSSREALRAELLPRAPRLPVETLVARADAYARASGYPIQFQWTLIDGVNDGPEELEGIARLLAGRHAMMNFIPYNAVDGLPWQRTPWDRALALARELNQRRVLTRLRYSAGQEVDGGCGQLRARHVEAHDADDPAHASEAEPIAAQRPPSRRPPMRTPEEAQVRVMSLVRQTQQAEQA